MGDRMMRVRRFFLLLPALAALSGCATHTRHAAPRPGRARRRGDRVQREGKSADRPGLQHGVDQEAPRHRQIPGLAIAQDFERAHRALLDAQPSPPRSFVLNFLFDSMELTPGVEKYAAGGIAGRARSQSRPRPRCSAMPTRREPRQYNLALSAERARAVAAQLKAIAPDMPIEVKYFGDKVPLVPSPPGCPSRGTGVPKSPFSDRWP